MGRSILTPAPFTPLGASYTPHLSVTIYRYNCEMKPVLRDDGPQNTIICHSDWLAIMLDSYLIVWLHQATRWHSQFVWYIEATSSHLQNFQEVISFLQIYFQEVIYVHKSIFEHYLIIISIPFKCHLLLNK